MIADLTQAWYQDFTFFSVDFSFYLPLRFESNVMEDFVLYSQDLEIAVLTINRPTALNALNQGVLQNLESLLNQIKDDESVRAVIITGSGSKSFVAGADISELAELNYEDALALSLKGQKLFSMIENFNKPVLAAVNGYAFGGGCELSMSCHLRIASDNAVFGQPEVKLGVIAGYGGTQRLTQLIGKTRSMELLLTADSITAPKALEWGLLNALCSQAELLDHAKTLLRKITRFSPIAVGMTIDAINAGLDFQRNGYETEALNFAKCVNSQDGKEGTKAFLEKRQPNFTGK